MSSDRKAHFAYLIRFTIGVVLYSSAIFSSRFWPHSVEGTPWRFVSALLPMIGACVCAWAMRKMFQDIDEMQQKKMLDALVISSAGTILTCLAYGFMEEVGLPLLNASWVVMVWGVYFIIGTLWTAWRYR